MMRTALHVMSIAVIAGAVCEPAACAEPDLVSRGRNFSELVCSACHVVSTRKNEVPILRNPGPSFAAIAARASTTEATLRIFLETTHANMGPAGRMPNPRLADYQIDEVVAYILSLRGGS